MKYHSIVQKAGRLGMVFFLLAGLFAHSVFAQNQSPAHTVFLIGDAGEPDLAGANLQTLSEQLRRAGQNSTLIFLGDNIYPKGLADKNHPDRQEQEQKLVSQLEVAAAHTGGVYVIPGNHDWAKGKQEGWQHVLNQQKFVMDYYQSKEVFQPRDGCPGPVERQLAPGLWLIMFDMQWLLHKYEKPGEESSCDNKTEVEVLLEIEALLQKHRNERVILAAHHPLYSYGSHGGRYPLKDHIFPLTAAKKNLYIPLPGIGSIYPLFRSVIGNIQDIPHPQYKAIRNTLEQYLQKHKNAIYAAGHEHSLQHIVKDSVHYIVSGSGSKTTYVAQGKYARYAASEAGFVQLDYFADGSIKTTYWTTGEQGAKKAYEAQVFSAFTPQSEKNRETAKAPVDKTVTKPASLQYKAGKTKQAWLGKNYRDVWERKIDIEVFDIQKEKGGLTPVKVGGGMQTKSLRLEAKDGKQYVLRSIEKYAINAMPELLRQTIAVSIVQDQISASHPYGALIVPFLAEAAGIYHTNPRVVYIPDDPALGDYREKFANTLALFEERPAKDWSDTEEFGGSDDLVNTLEVLEELQDDNDNRVDQHWVLKSRLFDIVIADWDRHDDQWRWASFEEDKGKMYRPIPRDRDQAFFVNEGIMPKIVSRRWAMPKVEGFNEDIRWAPGLAFNARYFDRSFLTAMSRSDWEEAVTQLQALLTDEAIDHAVAQWPAPIYELTGLQTARRLKARRDNLMPAAIELYEYLAREVDVMGSDKDELFEVTSLGDGVLRVKVSKISKKGNVKQVIYDRTFFKKETKEIRLHGRDGEDQFVLDGEEKSGIKVRTISGEGKDEVRGAATAGIAAKVYDTPDTNLSDAPKKVSAKLTTDPAIHRHDRMAYKYDVVMPLLDGQFNRDDGIFIGGGFIFTKQGWRKSPFAARHIFRANFAFATHSFNIKYDGLFTDAIGRWDLGLLADVRKPFFVNNFFGIGNNSFYDVENRDIDYYRVRFENTVYRATLINQLGAHARFAVGAEHRGVSVEEHHAQYLAESGWGSARLFDTDRRYAGLYSSLEVDTRDNRQLTTRGLYWNTEVQLLKGTNSLSSDYHTARSSVSFYYSFKYPARTTLAWRVGGAHNFSDITPDEFYNATTLGGKENLRGFRRTRFYGQTNFYNNIDLRIKLFDFRSYLFPGQFGILGFHDIGRVWVDGEQSSTWHDSAGGGVYVAPLGKAVLSFTMAFTDEENLPVVALGFFF